MGPSLTLDPGGEAISLVLREEADFGRVLAELSALSGGRYGVPRVVAVDRSERRTGTLPIIIDKHGQGSGGMTDADAAVAELAAIDRLLARSCSLLLEDAALTESVTLRTLPSPGSQTPNDPTARVVLGAGVLLPTLKIVCEPYTYADQETLRDAATALPALIDLSSQTGSYETPLEISLALSNMTQIILGLIEEEHAAWGGWLVDANDLSWDGGANAADGNAAGGYAWKASGGVKIGASIAVTAFPRGEYALWVRSRMTAGSAELWCATIGSSKAVTIANTAYRWHNLGRLICPTRHTYGAGTASTSIFIDPEDSYDGWIDRIAFVRASAGYLAYDGAACDSFAHDGQHAYVDGRTDYEDVRGGALHALRGKLCAIVETDGASGASLSPTVLLKAEPRSNLWR